MAQGNRYGLLLVLPNRNDGLVNLETQLINANYTPTMLMRRMIHRQVNVTLPRFKIQFDLEMSDVLKQVWGLFRLVNSAVLVCLTHDNVPSVNSRWAFRNCSAMERI